MTKEEMKEKISELEEKISELEDFVDYLEEVKDELECQVEELSMKGGINDLDNFIWRLKVDGFYCDKLQTFIDEYLKYYND